MSKRPTPPPLTPAVRRRARPEPAADALAVLRGLLGGPGAPQATPDRVLAAMLARSTKSELIDLVKGLAAEAALRRPAGRPAAPRASREDPLGPERAILWLEDVAAIPYVLEAIVPWAPSRLGAFKFRDAACRIFGFSELDERTLPGKDGFTRRVFWLPGRPWAAGEVPCGAVDPRSIEPGIPGRELRSTNSGQA